MRANGLTIHGCKLLHSIEVVLFTYQLKWARLPNINFVVQAKHFPRSIMNTVTKINCLSIPNTKMPLSDMMTIMSLPITKMSLTVMKMPLRNTKMLLTNMKVCASMRLSSFSYYSLQCFAYITLF